MTYLVFTPFSSFEVTRSEFVRLLSFNEWYYIVWDRLHHDFSIKVNSFRLIDISKIIKTRL